MSLESRIFQGTLVFGAVFAVGEAAGWWMQGWHRTFWQWMAGLDARLWQAVIAGLFLAAGWIVNGWQERRSKAALRREKLRDYHKALFAEIRDTLAAFDANSGGEAEADEVLAKMKAKTSYIPFIPRERHDRVFSVLLHDIDVLPRQTIDAIVAYYSVLDSLASLAEDMRSDWFKSRTTAQSRRIALYEDYREMRLRAFALGDYALGLIDAFSNGGAKAADAFNSRAVARNVPQQGSE